MTDRLYEQEPEFTLWDRHPLLPLLRFADIEASGIHEGSYPIQFGWCSLDLKTSVVLVKPEPEWTLELFDPHSYEMHGISYHEAMDKGVDATEVAHRLNGELQGKSVISDSVNWERYWTTTLSDTTNVPIRFDYNDFGKMAEKFGSVFDRWCVARYHRLLEAVDTFYPHTHRADEDALRMAALTRMCLDRQWAEWLLDRASDNSPEVGTSPLDKRRKDPGV